MQGTKPSAESSMPSVYDDGTLVRHQSAKGPTPIPAVPRMGRGSHFFGWTWGLTYRSASIGTLSMSVKLMLSPAIAQMKA